LWSEKKEVSSHAKNKTTSLDKLQEQSST